MNTLRDKVSSFQLPHKILFGVNVSKQVGSEAKNQGGKKVLLITDSNLMSTGIPQKIEENLVREDLKVDYFTNVEAEPSLEVAEEVAAASRSKEYDTVVGVGGGSVLDMAKVAAIAPTNPEPMRNYLDEGMVRKPGLPKILLPTTSGTGSEVTNVAVVTDAEEELKTAIISPYMLSDVALVDPILTYTLPPRLTASTGLDALSHALEALMSINSNPITDVLALKSIQLIFKNLPSAYENGNVESRYGMSLGSLTAGLAFGSVGVCLGHAAAYTFAVTHKVSHGVSCGLVLPYVFKFNAPAMASKLPDIAAAISLKNKSLRTEELTQSISEAIFRLMNKLQAPIRLRALGIPRQDLPKMADRLLDFKRLIQRNPRPISRNDAMLLVKQMW